MHDSRYVYIGSFVSGALVTILLSEIYRRYQNQSKVPRASIEKTCGKNIDANDARLLASVRHGPPAIVDGIEGCIGNTPLFRIKSLSQETGCEILAKAEVSPPA